MRVQDLQEFLSKFTEAKNDGSRQGNAISNAIIMVEVNGYLEKSYKDGSTRKQHTNRRSNWTQCASSCIKNN